MYQVASLSDLANIIQCNPPNYLSGVVVSEVGGTGESYQLKKIPMSSSDLTLSDIPIFTPDIENWTHVNCGYFDVHS